MTDEIPDEIPDDIPDDVRAEMDDRIRSTVWCTLATVDPRGRARTRIVHPVWDGATAWIGSRPTPKLAHVEANPGVSLMYWDPRHQQVTIDGLASVHHDDDTCRRVWDLFGTFPEPYGFDPSPMWPGGPEAPGFVVIRVEATRVSLFGAPPTVWRRPASDDATD